MAFLLLAIFMPEAVVVVLTKVLAMLVLAEAEAVVAQRPALSLAESALQFMAQLLGAVDKATVAAVAVLATAVTVKMLPAVALPEWAVLEYLAVAVVAAVVRERPVGMVQ